MQLTNSRPNNRQIPPDEQRPPIALLVGTFFVSFFLLSIFYLINLNHVVNWLRYTI
jgi:hypothetical protein